MILQRYYNFNFLNILYFKFCRYLNGGTLREMINHGFFKNPENEKYAAEIIY